MIPSDLRSPVVYHHLQVSPVRDWFYLVICVADLDGEQHPHDEGHGGGQENAQEQFVKHRLFYYSLITVCQMEYHLSFILMK